MSKHAVNTLSAIAKYTLANYNTAVVGKRMAEDKELSIYNVFTILAKEFHNVYISVKTCLPFMLIKLYSDIFNVTFLKSLSSNGKEYKIIA